MSDEEFRDRIKRVAREHDPDTEEVRAAANDLEALADKWDALDEAL